jgi:aspartate/glutamate racemase
MKTIGILGGMSWQSTAVYYRWLNEAVRRRMGGLHSARIALVSVDFATIDERAELNRIIFDELCVGTVRADSRDRVLAMIEAMDRAGADAVIAGCTEIELLVGPDESPLPLFDTTAIHAEAAVERALEGETTA